MVAFSFFAQVRTIAAAAAIVIGAFVTPAFANSAATADVTAPLRAAAAAKPSALGSGDSEFRSLFASWQSLDTTVATSTASIVRRSMSGISIPSRMPLDSAALTSSFGMRTHPILGGRRGHRGIDLASPTGTPIRATADGVVGRADWFSSYGLYVSLEHGGNLETRYGHMSRLNVAAGQAVRKGDIIGYVGSTGRSTGPHLHYEVRVAGIAVNPVPYMQSGEIHLATGPAALAVGGPED